MIPLMYGMFPFFSAVPTPHKHWRRWHRPMNTSRRHSPLFQLRPSSLFFFLAFAVTILIAHFSTWRYPVEIPRLREPEGKRTFSPRTRLAYYTDAKELFREAYEKVNTSPVFFGCSPNKNSTPSTARHVSSLVLDSATKSSSPQLLFAGLPPSQTIYLVV
jgi:hypothetical protein